MVLFYWVYVMSLYTDVTIGLSAVRRNKMPGMRLEIRALLEPNRSDLAQCGISVSVIYSG